MVPNADLSATRMRLASQCIAIVPSRFPKNTPFGAACMSAWMRGHRTLAKHGVPRGDEWDAALKRFDAAVHAMELRRARTPKPTSSPLSRTRRSLRSVRRCPG